MKHFLNAGFGFPLGAETLDLIKSLGFAGIRQGISSPTDPVPLLEELVAAELQPIILTDTEDMEWLKFLALEIRESGLLAANRPAPFVEITNEPDRTFAGTPEEWGDFVRDAADVFWTHGGSRLKLVSGGITTTDQGRMDWLARGVGLLPRKIHVGYHTYRTTVTPSTAHAGFASRDAEFARLKQIAGGRAIINTEIGWHTARSCVNVPNLFSTCGGIPFRKKVQFNDAQVAAFAAEELAINFRNGAEALTWYQLNDGPGNGYEDHFGIRYLNGVLKPVAGVFGQENNE